ncbi:MAG: zinc ribbon-containing protein [Gammaproteobacteria bacterium]|nr:zinc ribbon-containing protein [Gammaproteobacteria bacterium]
MSKARKRAKALAKQVMEAMRQAKEAEARAVALGEEMMRALAEAKAEEKAETEARTIIEYPSGRYECAQCGHSTLFTEPTQVLPKCDNCGATKYKGHEPKVTKIEPPPPKRYTAGMYQCGSCGTRSAVAEDCDELPECDFCGRHKLEPLN